MTQAAASEPTTPSRVPPADADAPPGPGGAAPRRRQATRRLLLAAAVLAVPRAARAQAGFPDRPIQLLVGFTPGGNIDLAARLAAPVLERALGGPVTVVNRPGAGGTIMLNELAREPRADGHAAGFASFPALVAALHEGPGGAARYRLDSFAWAGMLTDEPYTLFVGTGTPYRSLRDLVEAARARPEEVPIAGAGAGLGSAPRMALARLEAAAGVRFSWVPMQGAAQAMTLVQGGHAAGGVSTVSLTVKQHAEGQVRVLGLMDAARWDRTPDIPTFREQGFDVVAGAARGIVLPAATPPALLRRWEEAVRRTAEDPGFRAQAERDNVVVRHLDAAAMAAFVAAQDREVAARARAASSR